MVNDDRYDVVVAGGGSAGVAAAVGAARTGARTLLLERGPCLGGAATLRNVLTYCGLYTRADPPRQVVFGVAEEVLRALRRLGAVSEPTRFTSVAVVFDPESVKLVLDRLCRDAGVEVRLGSQLVGADRFGSVVDAVRVADHQGLHTLRAAAFVDATGEADLAAFGGAAVRYGNGGHVQNGTLGVRFGGIPATAEVTRDALADAVAAAKLRGAPLLAERGLVARLPISGDIVTYVVDEGYDARDARDLTRAEMHARVQAQDYLAVLRTLPGCANAYIVGTGPEIGTRESRHILGRYRLTTDEVLGAARHDEVIALGAWPIEYHPAPGVRPQWRFISDDAHYHIPWDVLRSKDTDNLFAAGRTVDADRYAGASLRVMGTAFATGHAAGVGAALHAGVTDPGVCAVQRELLRQQAYLELPDAA
ncbi:FAD-dependent oxidoreductase [Nocardia blacklockiae]|uniref:FAD-dependent oxidoreductase n=1 Tax=Nocardia blacklockiae TaxID=480036 RepID=UPI0018962FB5|nr:FAD-dependent oxidoreductase [Nocardia blacklockiae]MBF6175885.1 FAD-dependent oxidoreductase [Nocardia blacklockiae]